MQAITINHKSLNTMKKIFISLLAISAISITACNNSGSKNDAEKHDMNNMSKDSARHATARGVKDVKVVSTVYTNVDTKVAATIKEIVDHYLHIKNALTNDDGNEAANGAKAMGAVVKKMDKSFLTSEQKIIYDKNEDVLKKHVEHISKNGDKVEYQRPHFLLMSEVVYDLVRNFGAGMTLYHDHCPMYNENQGAMWLSEMKEVKNPYFGSKMITCGTIEEVIK
jgi:hypothetical protein